MGKLKKTLFFSILFIMFVLFIPHNIYAQEIENEPSEIISESTNRLEESSTTTEIKNDDDSIVEYTDSLILSVDSSTFVSSEILVSDEMLTTNLVNIRNGWSSDLRYYYLNGEKLYGQQKIEGSWYCFDLNTGVKKTGITYLNSSYSPNGEKYVYYDNLGRMQYKQQKVNGSWYVFDKYSGAMKTGLITLDKDYTNSIYTKTCLYNPVSGSNYGVMLYGQQKYNNHWYCFDFGSGNMKTGIAHLDYQYTNSYYTKTCLYSTNAKNRGQMLYGQQKYKGAWYCFDLSSGAMRKGLFRLTSGYHSSNEPDKTVLYDSYTGKMLYGQQKFQGHWYCFDLGSGAMKTGFFRLAGNYKRDSDPVKTVLYGHDGKMAYGRINLNGDYYYFDKNSGAMRTNTWIDYRYYNNLGRQTIDNSNWKDVYLSLLQDIYYEFAPYSPTPTFVLINLNGDPIPELFMDTGTGAGGGRLYSVHNNRIISQQISRSGLKYNEGNKYFIVASGLMGHYSHTIYKLENGNFYRVEGGDVTGSFYLSPDCKFTWQGKPISRALYMNKLNKYLSFDNATIPLNGQMYYDYEIRSQIYNY